MGMDNGGVKDESSVVYDSGVAEIDIWTVSSIAEQLDT
jgi:hypothetical protein